MVIPRPIKSDLKSHRIVWEEERIIRWSYMKLLREHSTLKEFYPEINPSVEAYKFRDNMWGLYSESLDGMGDPWMYLIDGPEKAMLIDTGFGCGDLKGLCRKLVGDKELIVVNTHNHFDHAYGNGQFDKCYCHEYEVPIMETKNNPHIWDYLFDENGKPKWTEFDRADLIDFHPFEIIGVKDGHIFDLGGSYEVEAVLMPGHTPGQCAYYDHHNHTIFIGDVTGSSGIRPGQPGDPKSCTIQALRDALKKLQPRFEEIQGVFSGHSMPDQSWLSLQYLLDTCERILKDPWNYDTVVEHTNQGTIMRRYAKLIYQGTAMKYTMSGVYYPDDPRWAPLMEKEKESLK